MAANQGIHASHFGFKEKRAAEVQIKDKKVEERAFNGIWRFLLSQVSVF